MIGLANGRKGSNQTPHTHFAYFLSKQLSKNAHDDSNLLYMPFLEGSERIRTSGTIDLKKCNLIEMGSNLTPFWSEEG